MPGDHAFPTPEAMAQREQAEQAFFEAGAAIERNGIPSGIVVMAAFDAWIKTMVRAYGPAEAKRWLKKAEALVDEIAGGVGHA